jgi:hypothetical protein
MINKSIGRARGIQLCSVADAETAGVTIAGQTFVPDAATAYVEFYLSHAFPVYLDVANPGEEPDRTTIHPATIANSYRSLRGKVLNLAHLMRSYDPENNVRDRIFGTVMAVEFPETPSDGWKVQGDPDQAPGIRAVAAMHKAAEGVQAVIDTWAEGKTLFSETQWTVSMENESHIEEGGWLIKFDGAEVKSEWAEATPADFGALGWTYVPWALASAELKGTLKKGGTLGLEKRYRGLETLYLNEGLNGKIFYYGVALTPAGKESHARVARITASADGEVKAAAGVAEAMEKWIEGMRNGECG